MSKNDLKNYVIQTMEYLKEDAFQAKASYLKEKNLGKSSFKDGVLMGYYYAITLFKKQAELHGIDLKDINLDDIDPDKDLLH
ncbi:MAG: hypothetical protein RLN62_02750 [Rickettsiales bacterium]